MGNRNFYFFYLAWLCRDTFYLLLTKAYSTKDPEQWRPMMTLEILISLSSGLSWSTLVVRVRVAPVSLSPGVEDQEDVEDSVDVADP